MTYRAAVIGLGRMGSTFDDEATHGGALFYPYCHAPTYVAAPNVDLVAGADLHDEQRSIFGERWGLAPKHIYADYREMLDKENLDLVSVCVTARHRSEIVQQIAQSGVKAIWAEKPIAFSLGEADDMIDTCKKNGVTLAINCARRYNPFFAEARRMAVEGELGKLLQVTAYARCGLSHNGSHAIDTIRYLAGGEVQWVFGEMASDEAAVGDDDLSGNGYLAFDNGVRAYLRSTDTGCVDWEFDLIGTEARVRSLSAAQEFEILRRVQGGSKGRGHAGTIAVSLAHALAGHGFDYRGRPHRRRRKQPPTPLLGRRRPRRPRSGYCPARIPSQRQRPGGSADGGSHTQDSLPRNARRPHSSPHPSTPGC